MLMYVALFFILAVVAGLVGFTGLAATFAGIAKILFWLFLILFAVTLLMHLFAGKPPRM